MSDTDSTTSTPPELPDSSALASLSSSEAPPIPEGVTPAIEVEGLYRSFLGVHAVRGISFAIAPGQVVGFVGANGAGKTTTMRIISTLDYATAGRVQVCGIDVVQYPNKVRSKLGWMPDDYGTYHNMTVLEYLDFFARALGYRGEERRERIEEVMAFTDLDKLADRLINKLSKGMGQRLCLGRALIHDPEVLILDEPAAGLDPKARVELKHLIRILAEEGKTVFISSHILSELGEMCDSLLFINQGQIIHHGSADSLKRSSETHTFVNVSANCDPQRIANWATMAPNVTLIETTKEGARIEIDSAEPEVIATVLKRMINDDVPVTDFHQEERKLEDAFIDILSEIEASGEAIVS